MSNDLEIAKRLAAITGKPLSDFYQGEVDDGSVSSVLAGQGATQGDVSDSVHVETNTKGELKVQVQPVPTIETWSDEVIAFQKLFKGSTITNNKIMGGRIMTRKEYLQYTKGLMREDVMTHPLLYRMFRAEGQSEAAFPKWLERFPEPELEYEDE